MVLLLVKGQIKNFWKSFAVAISFCITAFVITMGYAIRDGVADQIISSITNLYPHAICYSPPKDLPDGTFWSPMAYAGATVFHFGTGGTVSVVGIDEEALRRGKMSLRVVDGKVFPFKGARAIVGSKLARRLGIGVGNTLTLLLGNGKTVTLLVTGIIEAGFYPVDAQVVLAPIDVLGKVGLKRVYGVWFENPEDARKLKGAITWRDMFSSLIKTVELSKYLMHAVLGLFVFMAAVVNAVAVSFRLFSVKETYALLYAFGASKGEIITLASVEAAAVGIIGGIAGFALALGSCAWFAKNPIPLPKDVFLLDYIVPRVDVRSALVPLMEVTLGAFLSSLVVSFRVFSGDPAEVLRNA